MKLILLGVDTPIGLALIRELADMGVAVTGIGYSSTAIGAYSKHLKHFYTRETDLIDQLKQLASEHDIKQLLTISENDIEMLNSHRSELAGINLLIPEHTVMQQVLNKRDTYRHAEAVGIACPKSYAIESLDELDALSETLQFPVILKWANPQEISHQLEQAGINFEKLEYANNTTELRQRLEKYQALKAFPVIQNYCGGKGLGQFFFIHEGKVIQRFQHQRVHEWPPEGGVSSVCKSVPLNLHAELMEKSERLLTSMGWQGVAMVEYRYDEHSGVAWLMEINGRFWGSYPLAHQAGAQFGWLLYAYQGLGLKPIIQQPKTNVSCRFMVPEIRRLIRVLLQPGAINDAHYQNTPMRDLWRFTTAFFNPRNCYYVFSWRDPKPFLADITQILKKAFSR